jgi:hypothetical protein
MWDWAIWGALAAGFVAVLVAFGFLVVRILRTWRDLKRTRRHVARALDRLAANGERTATLAAGVGESEELERSVARLRRSLAQLAVLSAAIDEAQHTFDDAITLVPGS